MLHSTCCIFRSTWCGPGPTDILIPTDMKLRILSDLHIEFHPFAIPALEDDAHTILILAGDIGVIRRGDELLSFLQHAARQFRAVIYVMGNHEYYAGVWPDAANTLLGWDLPANVYVLGRTSVCIDGVVFVGATLWSDFDCGSSDTMQDAAHTLNDFHYIKTPGASDVPRNLLPQDVLADHQKSLDWLDRTLSIFQAERQPCVLVTHHGVSRLSIHEDYKDNSLNGAFVSACDWLIQKTRPVLVVHGHVHNSFDYYIQGDAGSTRVVVNPRGYTRRDDTQENPSFDPFLTIDLENMPNE